MSFQLPPPPPAGMGFQMPMFREFVPNSLRPWLYVLTVFCFQFSCGVYLGALNEIRGTTGFMIEDLLMLLFANLAGMAVYFPLLFRMKFRFTNQQLLCGSAIVIGICNLITMHSTYMPLLLVVCFISGMAKLQGTFECMSNIQLWITPKRDFAVFFPVLHIILLTSIEGSGFLAEWFAYNFDWRLMHIFIVTCMCFVLLTQLLLCKPFCPMPNPLSLKGIDFTGGLLISLLMLTVSYILVYGDYLMWTDNPNICLLIGFSFILAALVMHRMTHVSNPYVSPKVFTYRNVILIWIVVAIAEILIGCENSLEEILYAEYFHYEDITKESLLLWAIPGFYIGIAIDLLWLKVFKFKVWKLLGIGFLCIAIYAYGFYSLTDLNIPIELLRLPLIFRGIAYAILSATLMWALDEMLHDLEHFFMGLCIFNILHMYLAGAAAYAIYTTLFSHYLTDDLARYGNYITLTRFDVMHTDFGNFMNEYVRSMIGVAVKQVYSWVIWGAVLTSAAFFILDIPAVRKQVHHIPSWPSVGARVLRRMRPLYMKRWFG